MTLIKVLLFVGTVHAQCPSGEVYTYSGNACAEPKCCALGIACHPLNCPVRYDVRCECATGYYRDSNTGQCVLQSQCSAPTMCGENELYNSCGSSCREVQCSRSSVGPVAKDVSHCPTMCEPRCECKPGYIRHYDGTCVEQAQCYGCGANQSFKSCGSYCREPTCGWPNRSNWICDNSCTPRCECDDGFVRDWLGNCVPETSCPNPYCPVNEEIDTCYNSCEDKTCDNYLHNVYCPSVEALGHACTTRCKCKAGFVRNSEGACVATTECPVAWCGWNATWNTCGSEICEGTCAQPDKGHLNCGACVPRCQCLAGYVRNEAGYCVPWEQCPPQDPCGLNEYYTRCGSSCMEGKCSCVGEYGYDCYARSMSQRLSCSTVCEERCECQSGYVRDDNEASWTKGKCIAVTQCLPNPVTTTTVPPTTTTTTAATTTPFNPNNGLNCGCDVQYVAHQHIKGDTGTSTARCTGYGHKGSKGSTWELTCSSGKTLTATMGKHCSMKQDLNCDPNAPAIDCGCHPTAIGQTFISGGNGGTAECLSVGKKGSKGSLWKLSCTGQPTKFKNAVYMGKNCALQDDLWCGTGAPPVINHCGCESQVAMFKDIKCIADNVYSCTGLYNETVTFSAKKCSKIFKKAKCAYSNTITNPTK